MRRVFDLLCRLCFRLSNRPGFQALLVRVVRQAQYLLGVGAGSPADASGEHVLATRLRALQRPGQPLVVVDAGANVGQFAQMLRGTLSGIQLQWHAFEPGSAAFTRLSEALGGLTDVHLNPLALGAAAGEMTLHFDRPGSTLSSLYARDLRETPYRFTGAETIRVTTLDTYCREHGVTHIDLLKIDVEGHELEVLRGAQAMLDAGRISLVSFEFGGTHVDSRVFMRDFFRFFEAHGGPRLSRMTPAGLLLPLPVYHVGLEQFDTSNYLVEYAPTPVSCPHAAQVSPPIGHADAGHAFDRASPRTQGPANTPSCSSGPWTMPSAPRAGSRQPVLCAT